MEKLRKRQSPSEAFDDSLEVLQKHVCQGSAKLPAIADQPSTAFRASFYCHDFRLTSQITIHLIWGQVPVS
jgi:hypothetical protein